MNQNNLLSWDAEQLAKCCAEIAEPGLWEPAQTIFKTNDGLLHSVATRYLPLMFEKYPEHQIILCVGSMDYDKWFLSACGIGS